MEDMTCTCCMIRQKPKKRDKITRYQDINAMHKGSLAK